MIHILNDDQPEFEFLRKFQPDRRRVSAGPCLVNLGAGQALFLAVGFPAFLGHLIQYTPGFRLLGDQVNDAHLFHGSSSFSILAPL